MSKNSDNGSAGAPDDDWSDESTMIRRGDDDPYLAEMARRSRAAGDQSCFSGSASLDWDGHERRTNVVDCFDPYVVELTRPIRSDF